MVWTICFWIAVILLTTGTVVFFIRRSKGDSKVRYLGAGVFLAAAVVSFPVMLSGEKIGFALAMSISHSIRMFVVDTGVSDITSYLTAGTLGNLFYPYKILACLLYLLAPIFTLTVVLRYFSNFFERFRLIMKKQHNLYVFSDLNLRSYEVALNLQRQSENNGRKIGIVFCHSNEKDGVNTDLEEKARELNAIFVQGEMLYLRLNSKKRYIAYFNISEYEDENVDNTLRMIDAMTRNVAESSGGKVNQKNISIYCYSTSAEAEILLDSTEKGELRVVLIDEVRDAVYEHLYQHPLYTHLTPLDKEERKKISILIIGGGKTGKEFLKAAVWCGQMNEFDLEIHMIDIKGNLIRKQLEEECPELIGSRGNYNIHIHKGNIFSSKIEDYLDTVKNISYCVAALGEDEDNIRAALWLRKYFYLAEYKNQPFICAYIQSVRRREAVWQLHENTREGKNLYYNIIPFGNRGIYFGGQSDAAFMAEYLGLGVQAHYFRLTRESSEKDRKYAIQNYYQKQSNRRSSIANGIHISSKLWELGYGIMRVPRTREEYRLFKKCIMPVEFKAETEGRRERYYILEHERWMAYLRSEGWRLASKSGAGLNDIRACYSDYCDQFKNQNYLMKLHPALVPIEKGDIDTATLQEVDDMISEVNIEKEIGSYHPDYVQSDIELVDHIGEIVSGTWCGTEGIRIHGILVKEGECVICRLSDMGRYYMQIYHQKNKIISSEEILNLREEIKRCSYGVLRVENDFQIREEAYKNLAFVNN